MYNFTFTRACGRCEFWSIIFWTMWVLIVSYFGRLCFPFEFEFVLIWVQRCHLSDIRREYIGKVLLLSSVQSVCATVTGHLVSLLARAHINCFDCGGVPSDPLSFPLHMVASLFFSSVLSPTTKRTPTPSLPFPASSPPLLLPAHYFLFLYLYLPFSKRWYVCVHDGGYSVNKQIT